ncbi:MAG TPA: GTP-binding protein [Myxococcota bacterium]
MAVPVQIVSGFLGAGKTTAILARLRARRGQRTAVIVNDFGEAALDEAALGEAEPFRITNIPGGCVCCTAPEGFAAALAAVLGEEPDLLLIEPTGLARPQDLIDTIRRCPQREAFEMAPTLVLVDPHQVAAAQARGDAETLALLREQAEAADVLVANRTDLCSASELEALRGFVEALWPRPLAVHETRFGALPEAAFAWPEGEGARAAGRERAPREHAHADSTAGFVARSWQWPPHAVFSRDRLRQALDGAPLARFKGIFRTLEGVSRLELAGETLHERQSAFRRDSRADAIARAADAATLERLGAALDAARLAEDELRLDANRIELVLPDGRVRGVDRERLLAAADPVPDVSALFPKRAGSAARVSALFAELGVPERGSAVVVAGDGFASEPVALDVLRQGVLLHSLDGEPLPPEAGGPFRLLIPQEASAQPISCANVKGVAQVVIRAT